MFKIKRQKIHIKTNIIAIYFFISLLNNFSYAQVKPTCPKPGYDYTYICDNKKIDKERGWCIWECDTEASDFLGGNCYGHGWEGCCYRCYTGCRKVDCDQKPPIVEFGRAELNETL